MAGAAQGRRTGSKRVAVELYGRERLIFCAPVPNRTTCPRCNKSGLIRHEKVIKASTTERQYYCGACHYSWTESDDGTEREVPRKPPERSRSRVD